MEKELSASKPISVQTLFIVTICTKVGGAIIGGAIGSFIDLIGLICIALGIVRLVSEVRSKTATRQTWTWFVVALFSFFVAYWIRYK